MKSVDATDQVIKSLDPYIAAAGDASKRSRWSLLVLIVSSIFGYASFLSARSEAWPWHRLGLLETTRRCVDISAPDHTSCTDEEAKRASEFLARWKYVNTPAKTVAELSALAVDTANLKHHVERQRDIIMERISSQTVPVLGFGFDVNDLGKIATLTFMIMLFVLLLAIRRERQNVQLVRGRAQERSKTSGGQSSLDQVRALIYMRQVFSIILEEPAESQRPASFGKKVVYLVLHRCRVLNLARLMVRALHLIPLCFPLYVELRIALMDFGTVGIGEAESSHDTFMLFLLERIGFFISLALAGVCFVEWLRLDNEFARKRWRLDPSSTPTAAMGPASPAVTQPQADAA